jgi:hypothetical protein
VREVASMRFYGSLALGTHQSDFAVRNSDIIGSTMAFGARASSTLMRHPSIFDMGLKWHRGLV